MSANRNLPTAIALSIFAACCPGAIHAQTAPSSRNTEVAHVMAMLDRTHQFSQAEISPDGKRIAFVEQGATPGTSVIYVRDLHATSGTPSLITAGKAGPSDERDIAWSPDGSRVAFLSDAAKRGQLQLCVASADKSAANCLTHVKGDISWPRWSPDGKTIALLFIENAPRAAGPLAAETPDEGVVQEHPFEQRLALVDAATGKLRQITPASLYIYEYDWSPDGKRLVVTAAPGSGDDNWYVANLEVVDIATEKMKAIYTPPVDIQMAVPRWSPDGASIAFIGGLMSDEGATGGDVYVVPVEGGDARDITPKISSSPAWFAWMPAGEEILFGGRDDGGVNFGTVGAATQQPHILWHGAETIGGGQFQFSLSRDGKTSAIIRQSYTQPPEVWAGAVGSWARVTSMNASLKPDWGETESLAWTNGNFQIQGWLMYPESFDPSKKYPMVVSVHGGPAAAVTPHWPSSGEFAVFLSSGGYFVLFPNPRGSYGKGEEFTRANVKDYGYGDFQDIMGGVDAALKTAPIDPQRLGVTGWSYGGFMTMWAVTQTNRFRAAVAGAGLANWQSYYGENKIDKWMIPYFGASVYDDPAVYAKSSPITFIKNAKTPTLILVGDSDGECPPPQSYEFWHALKTLGVETEFVIYPHEGHRFSQPAHLRDRVDRVTSWFDDHLR
jgi:dipeptidyl aminopeptidase/acylaminoacyl peptidase